MDSREYTPELKRFHKTTFLPCLSRSVTTADGTQLLTSLPVRRGLWDSALQRMETLRCMMVDEFHFSEKTWQRR
jgi:hypothetical protein